MQKKLKIGKQIMVFFISTAMVVSTLEVSAFRVSAT